MSKSGREKVAVVLSGGGANGAYEVGILKALFSGLSPTTDYRPLVPDIFVGTSIGALNAAFLTSQWDEYGSAAIANLERFWLDRIAGPTSENGVFRIRGNPLDVGSPLNVLTDPLRHTKEFMSDVGALAWDGVQRGVNFAASRDQSLELRLIGMINLSSFISTEPMMRTLDGVKYDAIRQSKRELKIVATNWATGKLRVFRNDEMTNTMGPAAIRASASIPGFFPPVENGSELLCDGCVLMNTPLSLAIRAGATTLHVIYLDPDVSKIPLKNLRNTYDSFMRMMQITWAASYNDDIRDADRINRTLESKAERDNSEREKDGERAPSGSDDSLRLLTIYRYRPREPLPGDLGLLNFRRDRMELLIDLGFKDGIAHDSEAAGDILPKHVQLPVDQSQGPGSAE